MMGMAIVSTAESLTPNGMWTKDVEKAWESLYKYICKLFKDSIEKARPSEATSHNNNK